MERFDAEFGDTGTILADPKFAQVIELIEEGEKPRAYPPEMLLRRDVKVDLNSFFATNPELVKRGIGLQPQALADFRLNRGEEDSAAKP